MTPSDFNQICRDHERSERHLQAREINRAAVGYRDPIEQLEAEHYDAELRVLKAQLRVKEGVITVLSNAIARDPRQSALDLKAELILERDAILSKISDRRDALHGKGAGS